MRENALAIFQFHKGTIKTISFSSILKDPKAFQFHKGTIKTIAAVVQSNGDLQYFNSIKVRLKH